jgi:RNA polymerase sigma factor (sigma-70 family)
MSSFHRINVAPELVVRAGQGDVAAQARVYEAYADAVYTLVRRLVLRPAVAEELLQDTFIDVLRNLPTYRGDGPFGAWVRAIAVSKCLQYLRSPWHRSARWIDMATHDANSSELDIMDEASHPDAQALAQSEVERALATLGPVTRTVVWLHDVEGYTHGEIARLLGRTTSFSKSQLARAHERLRALLQSDDECLPCTPVSNSF